jgi:aspartyl/glutamyl-tRNA(Asn/Gln) amidotransferase C subunit
MSADSSRSIFTPAFVQHIAALSAIPLEDESEAEELAAAFRETLEVVDELRAVDVEGIEPAHHVSGLVNETREDVYEPDREFSQEEALRNATRAHDGYFVVPQVISQD